MELDPLSGPLNFFAGIRLSPRTSAQPALAQFRKLYQLDPSSSDAHWGLGAAYEALERYDEAIEEKLYLRKASGEK